MLIVGRRSNGANGRTNELGPGPGLALPRKNQPHDTSIASRIAKRYLDENMQQAWINPRLISMVSWQLLMYTNYIHTSSALFQPVKL